LAIVTAPFAGSLGRLPPIMRRILATASRVHDDSAAIWQVCGPAATGLRSQSGFPYLADWGQIPSKEFANLFEKICACAPVSPLPSPDIPPGQAPKEGRQGKHHPQLQPSGRQDRSSPVRPPELSPKRLRRWPCNGRRTCRESRDLSSLSSAQLGSHRPEVAIPVKCGLVSTRQRVFFVRRGRTPAFPFSAWGWQGRVAQSALVKPTI
jgi:hypothetical protein